MSDVSGTKLRYCIISGKKAKENHYFSFNISLSIHGPQLPWLSFFLNFLNIFRISIFRSKSFPYLFFTVHYLHMVEKANLCLVKIELIHYSGYFFTISKSF